MQDLDFAAYAVHDPYAQIIVRAIGFDYFWDPVLDDMVRFYNGHVFEWENEPVRFPLFHWGFYEMWLEVIFSDSHERIIDTGLELQVFFIDFVPVT